MNVPLAGLSNDDVKPMLSKMEKAKISAVYALIATATILSFAMATRVAGSSLDFAALSVVAYVLGLRHGVDADHISAIDNTTRKLMQEDKEPVLVGTYFSLGHSTVVFGLVVTLSIATRSIINSIPSLERVGSVLGTVISGTFLWLIGIVNIVIAVGIYDTYRELRKERLNASKLNELMDRRGFLNRFFHPLFKVINEPWQIYPIGVLFGLGFDTASEVALLAISVGISGYIPIWEVLVLPLMFTCGMVLVDTTDGVVMRLAYGWAFLNPIRKVYYNLTITIMSILVALMVGSIELLQVLSSELMLSGSFWIWLDNLNFEEIGYMIISMFVVCWLVSAAYYKYRIKDDPTSPNTIN